MESHHKQFFGAIFGSVIAWVGDHGHDIASAIAVYGGALVAVLSGISWVWDLINKYKHRND